MSEAINRTLRTVVLANWGIGRAVLRVLHDMPRVNIALVVTAHEQGTLDPWENAVYDCAARLGYETIQQHACSLQRLRDEIDARDIDIMICHAYMKKIPEEVLSAPRLGCINVHASLLPKYRGPAPAYWVLKNHETETGLTCHYMDEGLDTGDIICQERVPVAPGDTVVDLIEKQKKTVTPLLNRAIDLIADADFRPQPQDESLASFAPRP